MNEPTITIGETTSGPGAGDVPAGEPIRLPVEAVLQDRAFLTGRTGSGKSNSVAVVLEELLEAGYPALVFDADGEYVSLKEEFEILHVGGDQVAEKVVGPEHAEALATIGIDQRMPILVDLSGYAEDERDAGDEETTRHEMVASIASAFFSRAGEKKRDDGGAPYLLVAEEMHEFVPQQGALGHAGRVLVKVAKRGRSRGLGIAGISQRPASVDKDYITQCDWLLWHQLTWSNDTDVVREILGSAYADAIEDFDPGEAFLQADWNDAVQRIQVRRRRTTDLGQAPGLDGVADVDVKQVDSSILDDLDAAAEEARTREQRIAQLERRIEDLKDERDEWQEKYEDAEYLADVAADVTGAQFAEMAEQFGASFPDAGGFDTVQVELGDEVVSVPEVIEADVLEIRSEKRDLENELDAVRDERDRLQERVDDLERELEEHDSAPALEDLREDVQELVRRHDDVLDIDGDERVADLRERIHDLEAERDRLQEQTPAEFEAIVDVLATEEVQALIEDLGDRSDYRAGHTRDVIDTLTGADPMSVDQIEPLCDVGASSLRDILKELERAGVLDVERDGRKKTYRLSKSGLEDRLKQERARKAVQERRGSA